MKYSLLRPAAQKNNLSWLVGICLILAILFNFQALALAEGLGAQLTPSSSKIEIGKTVVITFKASAAVSLDNYQTEIKFDTGKFQYVAGSAKDISTLGGQWLPDISGNTVFVGTYGATKNNISKLCQASFKAIAKGTASFSATNSLINDQYPADSSISVTVIDPLPGNNNLKSLSIVPGTLAPAFAASQISYTTAVADGITKLTVSAVAEDSLAKVAVSGNTNLKDGNNTITIIVTAQNGVKKTYTIIATRAGPTTTPLPSPTPAATVQTPDGVYQVIDPPAEVPAPQGFYRTVTDLSGQMVTTYKALKGDLTLYYLSNQAGDSGYFYFDAVSQTYLPFVVITLPAQSFSVLKPESGVSVPDGFTETSLNFNGESLTTWQKTGGSTAEKDQYLLYLMDSLGDKGFYIYDKTRQLLSIYTGNPETTPAATTTGTEAITPTPGANTGGTPGTFNIWQLVSLLLGLLALALIGIVIWLIVRNRGGGGPDDDGSGDSGNRRKALPKAPPIKRVD